MKSFADTYKNSMKNVFFSLLFCALFSLFYVINAHAAIWEVTQAANNREKLLIQLDEPMPNLEIKRPNGLSLEVHLPLKASGMSQKGSTPSDSFVKSVQIANGDLKINMNKAGFGYILVSPASGSRIELEIYPDPLMERFYPADGSPRVSTNPNAATTAPSVSTATAPTSAPVTTPPTAEASPAPTSTPPASIPPLTPATESPLFIPPSSSTAPAATSSEPKTTEETSEERPVAEIPVDSEGNAIVPVAPPSVTISPLEAMKNPPEDLQRSPHTAGLLQDSAAPVIPAPVTPVAPVAPIAEVAPAVLVAPVAEIAPIAPVTPVQEIPADVIAPAPIPSIEVPAPIVEPAPIDEIPVIGEEPAVLESTEVEEPRPEAIAEALAPIAESAPAPIDPSAPISYGNSFIAPLRDIPADSPDTSVQPSSAESVKDSFPESAFLFEEAPPPYAYNSIRSLQILAVLCDGVSQNTLLDNSHVFTGTLLALNGNDFIMLADGTGTTSADASASTDAGASAEAPSAMPSLSDVAAPDLSTLDSDLFSTPAEPAPAPPPPAPVNNETTPTMPMTLEEAMEEGRPIIYLDPEGNEVPPPPDPNILLPIIDAAMASRAYPAAILNIELLLNMRLHNDDREHIKLKEKLLYNYAVALYNVSLFALAEEGQKVLDAAITAMNYNTQASHVPSIIDIIVRTHIALDNISDAEGYIVMLQELYPAAGNLIPELLLYLANIQLNNGEYAKAVMTTQRILDSFGNSPYVQEGAVVQTKAFYKQGHYDRALPMIDFINMRWPDSYIRFPDYLSIVADVQIAQQLYVQASETLWTEYNLDPTGPQAANILNRLAILYYSQADFEGAAKVQLELINSFPDHPEVPSALIRIAENSFQAPNPPLDTLLALFAVPSPRLPSITYQQIIDNYPNTPQAIEAETRLAAWQFFHQEYDKAMDYAVTIMEKYPDRPQFNVAQDVLLRAFSLRLENALMEENVSRALDLWERYPGVQNYYLPLEDDLRVALARGYLNRGDASNGLAYLQTYIDPIQNDKYGIYAYNLFLNQYLNNGQWQAILDLDEKVADWDMPRDIRNQHNYTVALACENLAMSTRAIPLWRNIVNAEDVPLYQRAYANYFLARDAELKQDLRGTYQHNLDALAMFEQLAEERSEFSDPPRIRESIAALMDVTEVAGRFAEALDWLAKYTPFVPQDSPDYAGLQLREARLYKKMGDTNKWRVVLRDIIQREPESVFGTMAASELKADQLSRDIERFVN